MIETESSESYIWDYRKWAKEPKAAEKEPVNDFDIKCQ